MHSYSGDRQLIEGLENAGLDDTHYQIGELQFVLPLMLAFQCRKLNLLGARTVCCEGAVIRERSRIEASNSCIFEGLLLTLVTQYYLKKFRKGKNEHSTSQRPKLLLIVVNW